MKVDITYKCSMGCTHCLSDCKPEGQEMSVETFQSVIGFHKKHNINAIILTGGEIFEHSEVKKIISMAAESFEYVALLTNGKILTQNEDLFSFVREIQRKRSKQRIKIQVTNDYRFYPQILDSTQTYKLKKLGVNDIDRVFGLYPQGRALINHSDANWLTIAPKCVNVRLLVKQGIKNFSELLNMLNSAGKFCTPTIAPDGSIKLGESALCPDCAHINDEPDKIIEKIKKFNCRQCKIPLERLKNSNYAAYRLLTED